MIAWLFDNQERITQLGFGSTLASNGAANAIKAQAIKMLGVTDFDREYAVKLQDIQRDESDGQALGINSTPTYFVNGIRTTDAKGTNLPAQYFELGIKVELGKPAGK
jgi:protein-disulfide isomerase